MILSPLQVFDIFNFYRMQMRVLHQVFSLGVCFLDLRENTICTPTGKSDLSPGFNRALIHLGL